MTKTQNRAQFTLFRPKSIIRHVCLGARTWTSFENIARLIKKYYMYMCRAPLEPCILSQNPVGPRPERGKIGN